MTSSLQYLSPIWWLSNQANNAKKAQQAAAAEAKAQADALQAREDQRQANIKTGQGSIDTAFGQFDEPYYDKFKQTYANNYMPQIADQFSDARGKLVATLAGRGTLESTPGADALGKLQATRSSAEAGVANQAQDAANGLRSTVANTKSNLMGLNLSSNDPNAIATQAQASAGSIVSPTAYPKLTDVFASALQPFTVANKIDSGALNPQFPWNKTAASPISGSGTAIFGK